MDLNILMPLHCVRTWKIYYCVLDFKKSKSNVIISKIATKRNSLKILNNNVIKGEEQNY